MFSSRPILVYKAHTFVALEICFGWSDVHRKCGLPTTKGCHVEGHYDGSQAPVSCSTCRQHSEARTMSLQRASVIVCYSSPSRHPLQTSSMESPAPKLHSAVPVVSEPPRESLQGHKFQAGFSHQRCCKDLK